MSLNKVARELAKQLVSCRKDLKESRCAPKKMLSNSKTGPYPKWLDWQAGWIFKAMGWI